MNKDNFDLSKSRVCVSAERELEIMRKICEDNPDLPPAFVEEICHSLNNRDKSEPFEFEGKNNAKRGELNERSDK